MSFKHELGFEPVQSDYRAHALNRHTSIYQDIRHAYMGWYVEFFIIQDSCHLSGCVVPISVTGVLAADGDRYFVNSRELESIS